MNISDSILTKSEKVIFALRELYNSNGYLPYKMSKFEEYDLYARNKDFLVSDNVITFTDNKGKLMALKPDVTLSIIKNIKDEPSNIQKLYYNENVYRASGSTGAFKEIMQSGVEVIGEVNSSELGAILTMAGKALKSISDEFVLDVSDMDILLAVVKNASPVPAVQKLLIKAVSEKNGDEAEKICLENEISKDKSELIKKLINAYGTADRVLPNIAEIAKSAGAEKAAKELNCIFENITDNEILSKINVDFSVVSDMNYYNGIVFKGFINGVPESVLSGGQYDKLMAKFNMKSCAVGFAIYVDTVIG